MITIEELKAALDSADEAYLTGMSNKGLYKRACKDIDGAQISAEYEENTAKVALCGETCTITAPLWESSCSCPSRSVCRHIIGAILWLKQNLSDDAEEPDDEEELPKEPEHIGAELTDALRGITPNALRRALGRELPRTVQDVRAGSIILTESSILSAQLPDGTAVRLLYPLEFSTCACHRKELCSHKAAAVLAWQTAQGILKPEDLLEQAQTLTQTETDRIHEIAAHAQGVLAEVFRWGLVRLPDNLPEHLEVAAVQCHSAKMADGERLLRELGSRLSDCRERRASFSARTFLHRFCECAVMLSEMQADTLTETALGAFRRSYAQYTGDLEILPVGMRTMRGGDYEGEVYYFLNMNRHAEDRFLSFSDLRPVFYDSVQKRGRRTSAVPWSLNMPLRAAMKTKMLLQNAKVSEGKLSSSQETFVAGTTAANLDCGEVRELIYHDFRRLAADISAKQPEHELQRLCFVHPRACTESGFDKHSQQFRMTLEDAAGNCITVKARYTAAQKEFIDLLERIGKGMTEHPEKPYVLLCTAYFEDGALCLFPIEVYDFIRVPEPRGDWQLPECFAPERTKYAGTVLELLTDAEDWLCEIMQSGLQSACGTDSGRELAERAGAHGLHGLAKRLSAFAECAEQSRHSMKQDCTDAMRHAVGCIQYIQTGREKLEVLSAIRKMGGTT